jgi:hypothetical protein
MTKNHHGGPGGSRTPDLRFRKPLLYPAELRDRIEIASTFSRDKKFVSFPSPRLGFPTGAPYFRTMAQNSKTVPRWRVIRIASKGQEICELQAKSAEAAIKRAIEEYGIDERWQKRLSAYQIA